MKKTGNTFKTENYLIVESRKLTLNLSRLNAHIKGRGKESHCVIFYNRFTSFKILNKKVFLCRTYVEKSREKASSWEITRFYLF